MTRHERKLVKPVEVKLPDLVTYPSLLLVCILMPMRLTRAPTTRRKLGIRTLRHVEDISALRRDEKDEHKTP